MSLRRVGPLCGLLFLPLYLAFTFIPERPEAGYSDERVLDLYRDGSATILFSSLLMAAAGVALLVFLADLHSRLRPAGGTAILALAGGLGYVAMIFVAGAFWGGYALGGAGPLQDAPDLAPSVTLARVLNEMGIGVLLIYGLSAAAVMIAGVSAAGRTTGVLPRGVVISGWIIAPLMAAGFAYAPQFLVPMWVAAVSSVLLGRPVAIDHLEPAPAG